jgi:hypothetical protein
MFLMFSKRQLLSDVLIAITIRSDYLFSHLVFRVLIRMDLPRIQICMKNADPDLAACGLVSKGQICYKPKTDNEKKCSRF